MIYILHDAYYDDGPIIVVGPVMDQPAFRALYDNYWRNSPATKWYEAFRPVKDEWTKENYKFTTQEEYLKGKDEYLIAYKKMYEDYITANPIPPRHCIEEFIATVLAPLGFIVLGFTGVCL